MNSGANSNGPCYIVVDPKITVTKKFNHYEGARCAYDPGTDYYDMTETIKVIDINDPECKVQ